MARADTSRAILLVEDDFLVRLTLADGLEEGGFEVLEAGTAQEALALLASRPDIAAMLTDINLPGGADGYALARAARVLRPELPVVYASGRFARLEEGRAVPGARFLAKPFASSLAVWTLEQALGERAEPGLAGGPAPPSSPPQSPRR